MSSGSIPPPGVPYTPPYQPPGPDGAAVCALVFGILSLTMCAPLGLVGIICGTQSRTPGGVRTGGIVCSIIGLALFVIVILVWILVFGGLAVAGAAGAAGGGTGGGSGP
jgi:hypothetical protein